MRSSEAQVRRLFQALAAGECLGRAAMKAGMHRDTARGYRDTGDGPREEPPRAWRTHPDVFEEVWPELEARLVVAPRLEAKTLLLDLLARYPGRFDAGQLRTLQRRVKAWRARHGPEKEVFFPQEHRPGEALQLDFTWATELAITIAGEAYSHMLCHTVLPYSNWSWATPCRSESMAALSEGLQDAVHELGGATAFLQTDHSTAATHDLRGGGRAFNVAYLALLDHLGMRPRTTGIGEKEQNGDVESLNWALKRDLEQRLLMRGSRDFPTHAAYRTMLVESLRARNATRGERFNAEKALLHEVPARRLPAYREIGVRVGQGSSIRVMGHAYSLPPRLIGERVRVRVHESRVEVFLGDRMELDVERGSGKHGAHIQYRHVIGWLLRKPGAFRLYRHREALFPTQVFRRAYERLTRDMPAWGADVEYLRIVDLAAKTLEASVEAALLALLERDETPRFDRVRDHVTPPPAPPAMDVPAVDLTEYDALLEAGVDRAAS